jgi:hypothetical protein
VGEGVKMVTQAKEMRIRRASLELWRRFGAKSRCGFEEKLRCKFEANLRIAIAVKLMVKMKNLFRLKDGLGLCLEDANVKQHLPLHSKL